MNLAANEQKFLEFYDQSITKIYRYVYFRVGSEQIAQDISAEAFLKTWQYLKEGKNIGNLSAMVYQICRNMIADNFRNISKLPISLETTSKLDLSESEEEIIGGAETGLELDKVRECLRELKDEYQELIIWHYIDDFSVPEICEIWGKSEGSVRTSLSRAIRALKAVLEGKRPNNQ